MIAIFIVFETPSRSAYEISDSGTNPGDSTILDEAAFYFLVVYAAQDTHDNTLYIDMGNSFTHPSDIERRFKIPLSHRITRKDITLIWYYDENGHDVMADSGNIGSPLSARIVVRQNGKVIFNYLESFVEKTHTLSGWLCLKYGVMCPNYN